MVGKFLDEDSLIKSYESLEREFTKKCQELSKLKREMEENVVLERLEEASEVDAVGAEEQAMDAGVQLPAPEAQKEVLEETDFVIDDKIKADATSFTTKFPEAKELSRDIAKELILNKALLKLDNPFYLAYLIVKDKKGGEKKVVTVENTTKGPEVIEEKEVFPKLLKGSKRDGFSAPLKKKYSSLEDARGDLISRYFS